VSSRAPSPDAKARSSAPRHTEALSSVEREQLARDLLALASTPDAPGVTELAAEVDAMVGAISPEDARRVCDEIETRLRVRQLYERFRSFHEASRRVARTLHELDKDLVELARGSELFRPEAYEDIALFQAALERAQAGLSRAGIAGASHGARSSAELAFISYLARAHPEAASRRPEEP
jgi:hypothetical protein